MTAITYELATFEQSTLTETRTRQAQYDELVSVYSDDLYRYAFWLTRSDDVAQDLVQETMLRAWRSMDSIRDNKAVKSWLITILRRENARRFERYQPQLVEVVPEQTASKQPAYDTSTEAFVLRQAMGKLAEEYREPLLMQVIGGYSCREIAEQLGISEGAAMTRLFRARQKLQQMLTEEPEETEATAH